MNRLTLCLSMLAVLGALLAAPLPARAMDCPDPMEATITALQECVQHAYDMGHIDNAGVATSLLSKISAASSAIDRAQPDVAIQILRAFINEAHAQSGIHIDAEHADHMAMHAGMVIEALSS